jgi:hypothetical protein
MSIALTPEVAKSVRAYIAREVAGGFTPETEIVAATVDFVSDDATPDDVRPYAEKCLRSALERHRNDQATWPGRTDCDRLDVAFEKLDANGVVARQNFSCCQNCGHSEMWSEIEDRSPSLSQARGYTFYHWQDTDSAVEGDGVFLAYGSVAEGESHVGAIGREIVAALRGEGLDPQWDESIKTRIRVPLEWRRRRPVR